ncbi:MAG: CDP-diacylglycerol--glycerol-3-phosphate 3-phosphatidyltransferase [Gemmatimonadota bacterium]|nr:MAG: CDP-diacylglycerol--glycerol-3-phosphate 3-phosphatidyltransferase [Gemmatimonadota bacterium]
MNAPNILTLFRIAITPLFVVFLFEEGVWPKYAATLFFLCAALSDFFDGYLARKRGSVTRLGRFLDPLADKILTSAAFISFAILKMVAVWMVYILVVREIIVTGLRVYSITRKNPLVTSRLAKWKTSCQMAVIFIILLFMNVHAQQAPGMSWPAAPHDWQYWVINGLVLFITALATATGIHYLVQNFIFSRRSIAEGGS